MSPLEVFLGILGLIGGLVVLVLVAWFAVMLVHLLVNVIPDRIYDMSLSRLSRRHRRPVDCCGVCPGIEGGGFDCTCAGNPRCKE